MAVPRATEGRGTSPTSRARRPGGRAPAGGAKRLQIELKRAYEPPSPRDGGRVLVDRLWPRGVSREKIKIDAWLKDLGPTTPLRKWFGHDPTRWRGFRQRYTRELAGKQALLDELVTYARRGRLTLVFGARDTVHNEAAVIREVLERKRVR